MTPITTLQKLIFATAIFFLSGCKSEDNKEKLTVDAGPLQMVSENNYVTLDPTVIDHNGQMESISWVQLTGTEVELVTNDLGASFTVPEITSDEQASFRITVTTKNNEIIIDDVNIIFFDSEPLISHNLPINNTVVSNSSIEIDLTESALGTSYKWEVINQNGATAEINIITESSIEIISTTDGIFQLKITAENYYRSESSTINYNVIAPWEKNLKSSISHLQDFIESNGSYEFDLTPDIPNIYNVRWLHNDEDLSQEKDISLTLDSLGRHKIALLVYNGEEEIFLQNWYVDVFKRQIVSPESLLYDSSSINIPDDGASSLSGLSIRLPEGSDYTNEEISIAANHIGDNAYSFSLFPQGAHFSDVINVSFPKPSFLGEEQDIYIRHTDDNMTYGKVIKAEVEGEVITFQTDHFSNFELVTGSGTLSEIDSLSTYNEVFAEDLTQSYLLFNAIYTDVNKAHLAINTSSTTVTTSSLLIQLNSIKDNAELLKVSLSNSRLNEVIKSIQRPNSYWVDRGIKGNYGSIQHAAAIRKSQDLINVLNDYDSVLKKLPAGIKLSDLDSTKLGQIRTSLDKVGKVLQPLFVLIDTAFAVWEIYKGDFLAASKSSVNVVSGGLQIYLGSAAYSQSSLTLSNGAKAPALIGALIATHVVQSFILEPYIYEPGTNFIDFITLEAFSELDRLDDITWHEFKAKMQVIKSGSTDADLDDFTDLNGLYEEFNNTVNQSFVIASELRREVIRRYDEVLFKNKFVDTAYINFEESYIRSLETHEWQRERIRRIMNNAESLVSSVKLTREAVINSILLQSEIKFSFTNTQIELSGDIATISTQTEGSAGSFILGIESQDGFYKLVNLAPTNNELRHEFDIVDIASRFGKHGAYKFKITAKDHSGNDLAESEVELTLPDNFWDVLNNKPEFLNRTDININISDFIRHSLLLESEPETYFSETIFGFYARKELDGLRVIDKDGDNLSLDFHLAPLLDPFGIDYDNYPCNKNPINAIDLSSPSYEECKADTVNNLPSIGFTFFSNENYHIPPQNPHMPIGFYGHLCQGKNPFNTSYAASNSLSAYATLIDWRISQRTAPKTYPWESDIYAQILSDNNISYSLNFDTEYNMPLRIGSSDPVITVGDYKSDLTFIDEISGFELFEEGDYLLLTLTLSSCNRNGAVKKVSKIERTMEFISPVRSLFLERAGDSGLEIIKIIAVKVGGRYEIIGYSSTEMSPSYF